MRFKCSSTPTYTVPTAIAALCTVSLLSPAFADGTRQPAPANSTRAEGVIHTSGTDGAGIIQNFETFNLGAGCNQNGWTGFCDTGVGFLITNESATQPTFGTRTCKHQSDGSAVAGYEVLSPVSASDQPGIVAADIVISDTTSLYQFIPMNGTSAFFNTRINFEADGTITALTTADCVNGSFAPTTGTWTPNTKFRIAVEVVPGSLKIYKNGVQIYSGVDIAQQCAPAGTPVGIGQIRIYAANATATASLLMDNINESLSLNPCLDPLPFCRPDVTGAGNLPDGVVNVSDLLAVINTWGQNGNPTGPRPKGDCAPGATGDCVVNVTDLLAVINGWGNCPVPTGACCLPNGQCLANQSAAQCSAAGGVYKGNDSTCAQANCQPVPANDNCAGAIVIPTGTTVTSNAAATTSPEAVPSCATSITRDIWFKHTATCTGNLTISTCNTTDTTRDTVLAVYTGTCGSLTQVACDDDSCSTPAGDLLSSLTMQVVAGNTYYIRVGSWSTAPANEGQIVLDVNCVPFNNDNCFEPTALTIGQSFNDSIFGATQDTADDCSGVSMSKARWYTVVGNGNRLTVDTCLSANALWDHRISVYCGASCDSLFCVAASNADNCGSGLKETVSFCAKAGQVYRIAVHTSSSVGSQAAGAYTIRITDGPNNCGGVYAACGLANDTCSGAIDVTANIGGANVNGDSTTATPLTGPDSELPTGSPSCQWNGTPETVSHTVWYKFTAPGPSVKVDLCSTTTATLDPVMAVYSGSCGSLVEIGCDDDTCSPGGQPYTSSITLSGLVTGQVYYIMTGPTGAWDGSVPGAFVLHLSVPAPPSCPPVIPTTGCTNQIAGNGPFDGVNGTRPSAGWQGGALGVMEDMVLCNAGGGTVNQIKVAFIDQTAANTGTLSTYNHIRVRIYDLSNGPISALAPCTAVPLYSNDFTVGTNCTKAIVGSAFGSDIELWTMTISPSQHFAQGSYGVYFSFPDLTASSPSNVVYIATGPTGNGATGNDSSPQNVYIWGNSTPSATCTPINSNAAQHSAWCAGGSVP